MFNPMNYINLALAGIWSQVWHWGTCIGLIILMVAAAYFTTSIPLIGKYLDGARKDLLWAAFGIAVFLAGQVLGAHDQARKTVAKQIVVDTQVEKVVKKTTSPKFKKMNDRWDKPEN